MCDELIEKKLYEILITDYHGLSFPDRPSCEPSPEQIERAIQAKDFDKRGYQECLQELVDEWNRGGPTPEEYNRREQQYHARRIANFAANKWDHPPVLKKDGSVVDGLHRIKAARHLGDKTIKVQIT